MCTWTKQLSPGCLSQGQGVTPLEFQHMRERYRIYRPMDPSPEKTLMAQGEGGGGGLGAGFDVWGLQSLVRGFGAWRLNG